MTVGVVFWWMIWSAALTVSVLWIPKRKRSLSQQIVSLVGYYGHDVSMCAAGEVPMRTAFRLSHLVDYC